MWGQYQYGGEAKDVCRVGDMGPVYIRSRKKEERTVNERRLWKEKGQGGGEGKDVLSCFRKCQRPEKYGSS